jgi:thiol:disulfide interchange protein DsbD
VLPELQTSLGTVFLLGVSLGLTACAATCLPFIGTLVLGKAQGRRAGMIDATLFLSGRLIAYTALGTLAGAFGVWFVKNLADGSGNIAIGLVSILSAFWLIFGRNEAAHQTCRSTQAGTALSPMAMGVALTLIPCAPLTTLLATAAAGDSAWHGGMMGLVFGLGAMFTPMLVLIPATASIAERLRIDQPWIAGMLRYLAATVLVAIGIRRIFAASEIVAWIALASTAIAAVATLIVRAKKIPHAAAFPIVFQKNSTSSSSVSNHQ